MKIYDFYGVYDCKNEEDLLKFLSIRSKNLSNEYELRNNLDFPYMTIMVKEDLACVHFFKDENDCGSFAYISENKFDIDGFTTFNIGSEDAETIVSNKMVIPIEKAYIIAKDFFQTNRKSEKINWFEL